MSTEHEPRLQRGDSAVLISVPHAGTVIPPDLLEQLSPVARHLPDTDWFVDRLYEWALPMGAGMLVAPLSRYVIDLNRPPDDAPLYDASATKLLTGLAPASTFSGLPVYRAGCEPDAAAIRQRVDAHWEPYHQLLREELARIKGLHGYAVLLDAHSIRSRCPLLFDGRLPDLNLGSKDGRSAASSLLASARSALSDERFTLVTDGRFKGGYITRHYGTPGDGVHALQLEMAQCAYMHEELPAWDDALASPMQSVLRRLIETLLQWKPEP